MKCHVGLAWVMFTAVLGSGMAVAQAPTNTVEGHLAAARAAAAPEHMEPFNRPCIAGSVDPSLAARPNADNRAAWHQ